MKYMTSEWKRRLDHWIETLKKDFYHPLGEIQVEAFFTMDHLTPQEAALRSFSPMAPGEKWGHAWEYCWMRGAVVLPQQAEGRRIVMDLNTGGETTVFVNGSSFGTYRAGWVRPDHHFIEDNCLTRCGRKGQRFDLLLEAYAGHDFPHAENMPGTCTGPVLPGDYEDTNRRFPRTVLRKMTFGVWLEEAYQLYMDLETLRLLADQAEEESLRADQLCSALENATLTIDFEQPLEERAAGYRAAREALKPVLRAVNGSTSPLFYAIGNSHLDLAWLWPLAETHRKTCRTFAAQLRLMEEYPEYKYLQSQPAAYEMCRQYYPDLYQRILTAVQKGQWIAEGAMWVEPDTNMPSGESLIRQILHGKRFFRQEFGVDSVLLWLPDSFGYSAALPQILKKSGVKYLVTQKIFWSYNESERFPYHYFAWQGADGTKIDTFLPTSYTYQTDPKEVCETWKKRVQKRGLNRFLFPFGYGDGGGGPARDHLEFLRREKNLEGMPRVEIHTPQRFFEDMRAQGGPDHTYVGELYFSAHRGVFTSQAAIKKGNRKAELALQEAEMWGAFASRRGKTYPKEQMDAAWKKLLLNQFHDILPGSSIARVYEEARQDHREILTIAHAVRDASLAALTSGNGVTVFNSLSAERTGLVSLPPEFITGAADDRGRVYPVAKINGQARTLVTVPPCGWVSLHPAKEKADGFPRVTLEKTGATYVLQNEHIRAEINSRGEVISLILLKSGREFAAGSMNRLIMYKDVPRSYDAWDIDSNYILQPVELPGDAEMTVLESGGLRAVLRVRRKLLHSDFQQDICLNAGSGRLDFVTHVDWRELHRLLKVEFPVDVLAEEAINEIQFGYVKRPTHRSRQYDADRYEVCNQRYSALCDESHGAAVINDCKYGVSMNGNALQLSLLRASASPEMRADNGPHDFTYAISAWEGSFLDSPVVREAYDLNVPLVSVPGFCPSFSAFSVDAANIWIDTVKPAEDGSGDWILRLYEAKKADTACTLTVNLPVRSASLCDLMENETDRIPCQQGRIRLHFKPFEIKTLRLRQ